ncbi:hypothetical protein BHM03_00044161 [Ensete ventricosum]|nr:hypothetical protein BHM03_00044161 [Ensete ventricosum]
MESRSLRLGGIGQLFPEFLPDARVPRVEVICPQPRDIYDTGTPRRVERNSHSCGSSFVAKSESRTEQFTPGDPDRRPVDDLLNNKSIDKFERSKSEVVGDFVAALLVLQKAQKTRYEAGRCLQRLPFSALDAEVVALPPSSTDYFTSFESLDCT